MSVPVDELDDTCTVPLDEDELELDETETDPPLELAEAEDEALDVPFDSCVETAIDVTDPRGALTDAVAVALPFGLVAVRVISVLL